MRQFMLSVFAIVLSFSLSGAERDLRSELEKLNLRLGEVEKSLKSLAEGELPTYAIPNSNMRIANDRASLGLALGVDSNQGLVVRGFSPRSVAKKQGIKKGDVLISIDSQSLTGDHANIDRVIEHLESIEPGTEVKLAIQRNTEEHEFTIETQALQSFYGFGPQVIDMDEIHRHFPPRGFFREPHEWGRWERHIPHFDWHNEEIADGDDVRVTDLNPELSKYFNVESGVLVLEAGSDSDLKPGDVIVAVGSHQVTKTEELFEQLANGTGWVSVQRDKELIELSIEDTLKGLRIERELRFFSGPRFRQQNQRVW